jgi:hypothetical protein
MIFIWYIYFLYRYIIENDRKAIKWIFTLSFISIFVFEGSIFLILLNFLILFWDPENRNISPIFFRMSKSAFLNFFVCAALMGIAYFYYYIVNSLNINLENLYPEGYTDSNAYPFKSHHANINKPDILLSTLPLNIIWLIPLGFVLIVSLLSFIKVLRTDYKGVTKFIVVILLLLSLINQFGLLILFLIILITLNLFEINNFKRKEITFTFFAVLLNLFFWFFYSLFTSGWYGFFPDINTGSTIAVVKKIILLLFQYPDNYWRAYLYFTTVPVLTLFFLLSTIIVILYISKTDYYKSIGSRFIMLILLLMIIATSINNNLLDTTRYFFFFYPLVLITILLSFNIISNFIFKKAELQKTGFIIFVAVFFLISEDFSIKHIVNIDSKEYNFRMVYGSKLDQHYFERWDVKTPADIVNKESMEDDIIIIDHLNMEYYLNRLDYFYVHYEHPQFPDFSINYGKNERWTNAGLIYTNQQLLEIFKNAQNSVWFLTVHKPSLEKIEFKKNFAQYLYYTSIDSTVFVYRIPGGTAINKYSVNDIEEVHGGK